MEIGEDCCWDQVNPLLLGTEEGSIVNSSDSNQQQAYNCGGPEELFVSGQATTGTSPPLGTSASSSSPGSSTAGVAPGAISPNGSAAPGPGSAASGTSCCENGRPMVTDPVSGQTVCSCQYDPSARLTLSYPRLSTSGVGVYGTPYPSTDQNPYPSIGVDSSAFYSPLSNPYALKDGGSSTDVSAWTSAGLQTTPGYYPYDPTLAAYGYSAGYDLAARRKNATRESTATLKAWLNEHKKNPYPTKGEKIMLAIITKMTLTQVSTWFANARRRLKKENKMTWEPKNKTDDDEDAIVSDSEDKDKDDLSYDGDKGKERLREDKDSLHHIKMENRHDKNMDDEEETDDEDRKPEGLGLTHHHIHHHNHMHHSMLGGLKEEMKIQDCGIPIPATKPKIWSLADTAACKTPPPSQQQPWLMPNSNCGGSSMVGMNSFALPSPTSSSSPYSRYSGFLGHYNGSNHSTMGNYNPPSGFPEVQTDTPPQTPPNMKLPSVANNIINSNSCFGGGNTMGHHAQQAQSTSYHHNNNNNNFVNNFNRMQTNQLSPQKERQDYQQQQQQQQQQQHQQQQTLRTTANPQHQHPPVNPNEGTAFKPFFKNSPPLNNGFVSPV